MSDEEITSIYHNSIEYPKQKLATLGSLPGSSSEETLNFERDFEIDDYELAMEYPSTFDYRDHGVVSEVKNQGIAVFIFIFNIFKC